ncbi:restriction endonuclease subunit S [Spirillospora albida]|uniref:restriction endonuclease subunit S n=1 Tax=Spirillospora albida TaxID=58123 RepID=UPI000A034FD2|nr:restriction endonuclease subunit S [Spirillospora albida]
MPDLPEGWRLLKLKDCGTWLSGGTPATEESRFWGGDIPWISAASLKDFHISQSDRRVTRAGARAGTRLVGDGVVLFVVRGMSLKTEFRVGVTQRVVSFGQDCKAIIPAPGIDGTFLALALKARSRDILAMVDEAGHGTGRLPTDLLAKLEIGVPPLDEQRKIAETLDAIDDQITLSGSYIRKLEQQAKGVIDVCLSPLAEAAMDRVGHIFEIKPGITIGPDRVPLNEGRQYLRVANVQRERIQFHDLLAMEASAAEAKMFSLRRGDLLIVEGHANPEEIGRCASVPEKATGLLYQNHLFRLRSSDILPKFAESWFNFAVARSYWRRNAATSSGLYTINSQLLRALPFPRISADEQIKLATIFTAVAENIQQERNLVARNSKAKSALMNDLLTGRVRV